MQANILAANGLPCQHRDMLAKPTNPTQPTRNARHLPNPPDGDWKIAFCNDQCRQLLGEEGARADAPFWGVFQAVDPAGQLLLNTNAMGLPLLTEIAMQRRRNFDLQVAYTGGGSGGGGPPSTAGAPQPGRLGSPQGPTAAGRGAVRQFATETALSPASAAAPAAAAGPAGAGRRLGTLRFQFVQSDGPQPVGVPSFLQAAAEPPGYYFALLRETGPAPAAARAPGAGGRGEPRRHSTGARGGGAPLAAPRHWKSGAGRPQDGPAARAAGRGASSSNRHSWSEASSSVPSSSARATIGCLIGAAMDEALAHATTSSTLGSSGGGNSYSGGALAAPILEHGGMSPMGASPEDCVRLGSLLGRGSFGSVHRGEWAGGLACDDMLMVVGRVEADPLTVLG
jgi:hypothetical protein